MAQTAEAVGFDSIWLGDHLLYDLEIGPRGPWEVWTSLAALAASTERVLLGPLVASAGFHEPAMLAKQAATVDGISGGRLILGLGSGWNEREYSAFGFPYDRRVSRFAEAFTIIRTLLADGEIDFTGEFYRADHCVLASARCSAGWPAVDGRVDAAADAVDHASVRRLMERVVERLWQHTRRLFRVEGDSRRRRRCSTVATAGSVSATCAVFIRLLAAVAGRWVGYGGSPRRAGAAALPQKWPNS